MIEPRNRHLATKTIGVTVLVIGEFSLRLSIIKIDQK